VPKKKQAVDPETIEPLCPFTNEKLTLIRHDQTGKWRAQGPFYFTKFFDYKRELVHWLMHRDGVAPDFPGFPKISVNEIDRPPLVDPVADIVEKNRKIQGAVDDYVDKNRKNLNLKK